MTATLDIPEQNPDLVLDQSADDYWNHYQLTFALYSVSDRAIPSAFDGLKPGQRRLLYQMHESKLLPGNKPQKSSKICSAVTGNLHPHGGASMYGAAALMAAETTALSEAVEMSASMPTPHRRLPLTLSST